MSHHRIVVSLVAVVLCLAGTGWADFSFVDQPYPYHATAVYGFGDSLMDAGNVYIATGGTQPLSPPYAQRRSNGPTFLEDLGPLVGAPTPTPSLAGGTDFAFLGANAANASPIVYPVPSVEQQVAQFTASGHVPTSNELYVLWGGANDLFSNQLDPSVPAQAMANQVKNLADAGAKQILILNMPPLQATPDARSQPPLIQAAIGQWVDAYNLLLASDIQALEPTLPADLNLRGFDVNALFYSIIANPAQYGLVNVTDPALVLGPPISIVPNPDEYLFWDTSHPTQAAHAIIAQAIVPEPAALSLMLAAAGVLLLRRRATSQGSPLPA